MGLLLLCLSCTAALSAGQDKQLPSPVFVTPPTLEVVVIPSQVEDGVIHFIPTQSLNESIFLTPFPTPPNDGPRQGHSGFISSLDASDDSLDFKDDPEEPRAAVPTKNGLVTSFDSSNFDSSIPYTASVFTPASPSGAAAQGHLVNTVNSLVRFHRKDGTLDFEASLGDFFAALYPRGHPFNAKVLYDQYAWRFVIVAMDQSDSAEHAAADTSRILLAVSDDDNPNGTWYMTAIDSQTLIDGIPTWADFPGLAIDEVAVYVTTDHFAFQANGSGFKGTRQWAVDKGLINGLYDGNTASGTPRVVAFDLFTDTGHNRALERDPSLQPAHVFGISPYATATPVVAGVDVFKSGNGKAAPPLPVSGGTAFISSVLKDELVDDDFLRVVTLKHPFTTQEVTEQVVSLGDVDDMTTPLIRAPQAGTSRTIETGDRRVLQAVWRDDALWFTTTIVPSGTGQTKAYWGKLDTTDLTTITLADSGIVEGDDIGVGIHTFFPSISVNDEEDVAIGFSASSSAMYPGSFFAVRNATDTPNVTGVSQRLRAGLDVYERLFGGTKNYWGSFSSMAVDPANECFWAYNQHAIARGTGVAPDDGRWGTAFGQFCACDGDLQSGDPDFDDICSDLDNCPTVANANQVDSDGDGDGDLCEICPGFSDRLDDDDDGVPDGCDRCPGYDDSADGDGDTVPDGCDACPGYDDSADADGDTVPDDCDVCAGFDDNVDPDRDGVPGDGVLGCDVCWGNDVVGDSDGDGVCDDLDLCWGDDAMGDSDGDGVCDDLDVCWGNDATGDTDGDGVCNDIDLCWGDDAMGDSDGDGVCDDLDVCWGNDVTGDLDNDGVCNDIDLCWGDDAMGDSDGDGVCDDRDFCWGDDATGDTDNDDVCDDLDVCWGNDAMGDSDGDAVCDDRDVCPGYDDRADLDGDNVPDGCDLCVGNDAAGDSDGDRICDDTDVCRGDNATGDDDGDQVCNDLDVCPNFDDAIDGDGDGIPDACDDSDGDGVFDNVDCAPNDPGKSVRDTCGVCGGDGTSCLIFKDGFESGNTTSWSQTRRRAVS